MAQYDAEYDFPVYIPHITLTYSYSGPDIATLPTIKFPIILGEEYTQELKEHLVSTCVYHQENVIV
jgi:hypothetical protein